MPPFTGRHSQGTRRTILEDRGTLRGPLHVSDLSDRGIPKAFRIMVNVLTPSGDLSAGIKRRQLFHFVGIDVEIELSKPYHCSLVLLRDRGIAEATCIVVDVLEDVGVLACRISRR